MQTITALILSLILMFSSAAVPGAEVSEMTAANQSYSSATPLATMAAKSELNLYTTRSTGGHVVAKLKTGDKVEVLRLESVDNVPWAYVRCTARSRSGWTLASQLDRVENILAQASGNVAEVPLPPYARMGVVITERLNVRKAPGVDHDRIDYYYYGDRIGIFETKGNWGRTPKGWVSLDYVYLDGDAGRYIMNGVVTATQLRVRSGPGTGYSTIGTLAYGTKVQILEQIRIGYSLWGCTRNGWVSMAYIQPETVPGGSVVTLKAYGFVHAVTLSVHSGPGSDYAVVGTLEQGDLVAIQEVATIDGVKWARIASGWVQLSCITILEELDPGAADPGEDVDPGEGTGTDDGTGTGTGEGTGTDDGTGTGTGTGEGTGTDDGTGTGTGTGEGTGTDDGTGTGTGTGEGTGTDDGTGTGTGAGTGTGTGEGTGTDDGTGTGTGTGTGEGTGETE